jgi:hypothetical protein
MEDGHDTNDTVQQLSAEKHRSIHANMIFAWGRGAEKALLHAPLELCRSYQTMVLDCITLDAPSLSSNKTDLFAVHAQRMRNGSTKPASLCEPPIRCAVTLSSHRAGVKQASFCGHIRSI